MTTMNYDQNLASFRREIKDKMIDVAIIPMENFFEISGESLSDIHFLSGFSGSNGMCLISQKQAILSVDGRYVAQAAAQTNNQIWEIKEHPRENFNDLLRQIVKPSDAIGVCGMNVSYERYLSLKNLQTELEAKIEILKSFETLKKKPHKADNCCLTFMSQDDMGESATSRLKKFEETITDATIIADKTLIGWIFGARRSILTKNKNSLPNCIALFVKNKKPVLFTDLKSSVAKDFDICDIIKFDINEFEDNFKSALKKITKNLDIKNIFIDYQKTPAQIALTLIKHNFSINSLEQKSISFESIKNKTEIANFKTASDLTSLAFIRTLAFLENRVLNCRNNQEILSEKSVIEYFAEECKSFKNVIDCSFIPISAFGPNTRIIHYSPEECANSMISSGLFLFDAGIHFKNSTTDMTRTIYIGQNPKEEFIQAYTKVLKSLVMFSSAKFPSQTKASAIDAIARYHIWKTGQDYHFGTGHGIGTFGNVHEKPSISSKSDSKITENMIITVEPGIYTTSFGIRLENMLLTVKGDVENFVQFEAMTNIPFCRKLIDKSFLTKDEIDWINEYHKQTYEKFYGMFQDDKDTSNWLIQNTQAMEA